MRSKIPVPIRIMLIVAACVILTCLVLYLLDTGTTNTMFADWFYKNFVYGRSDGGTQLAWTKIKSFIAFAVTVFVAASAFLSSLVYYLTVRYKTRRTVGLVSNTIRDCVLSKKEIPDLPPEYNEFKNQLVLLKESERRGEQLAEIETQRKNDLITYLAHDLKTPLSSVIGYLSLLDEAPDMPEKQKAKYVGITLEKAYRLEELTDEFFDITRFNLQSIVLSSEKINLSFMLRQMADEFYPILSPQGKRAVVHAPEGLTLWGDADKLSRVFNNVLKNASLYSFQNSVIDITATAQADEITITFTNQGNPIPTAKLETIFEKFFRLDASRSSHTGGAGLGLAIAKEIVVAHGGTITAKSDAEKTTFQIALPNRQNA